MNFKPELKKFREKALHWENLGRVKKIH